MKKHLHLYFLLFVVLPSMLQSQLAFFGDAQIGTTDAMHIAFPLSSFESGIVSVDRNGGKLLFGVGLPGENSHLSTLDVAGVALRGVQALNKKLEAENQLLKTQLDALLKRVEALENKE